jgi:hypothetical protein
MTLSLNYIDKSIGAVYGNKPYIFCENPAKHASIFCGQNSNFVDVKVGCGLNG